MKLCLLLPAMILASAADPSWRTKPIAEWDENDAKLLLTDSPWVKNATPERVRDMSPSERRDSGNWDDNVGKGVGLEGIGLYGSRRAAEAIARAHAAPAQDAVQVRWESALPTHVAEQRAGETDAPVLTADGYAIAVYGIALPNHRNLAHELKGLAVLKRYQKKDSKPTRVEILHKEDEDSATVVYLFPRSLEITKADGGLDFIAQIGRLVVSQYFYTDEMQFDGKLQVLMATEAPAPPTPRARQSLPQPPQ
jgi:hypothetical protein